GCYGSTSPNVPRSRTTRNPTSTPSPQNSTEGLDKPSDREHHQKHSTKRCDDPLKPQPFGARVTITEEPLREQGPSSARQTVGAGRVDGADIGHGGSARSLDFDERMSATGTGERWYARINTQNERVTFIERETAPRASGGELDKRVFRTRLALITAAAFIVKV